MRSGFFKARIRDAVPRGVGLQLPPEGISLEGLEKELIVKALERCGGNQTKAAQYLDLSRKTLIYRMEKYGLRVD